MKTYPLFKVHIPKREALNEINEVFLSGYINEGSQVSELTKQLQRILETDHLLLTNSGTSAITLAMRLAGVGHGDDVVSTPMTCVATNTPIATRGANIVWADVDPLNGMVTPETVAGAITPNTKAVIVVAWAGTPPDLQGIHEVCQSRHVPLIIDAAHAFKARFDKLQLHEWAEYTCYSFQAIKHFTTGDGGALVCRDDSSFTRAKSLKWFGLDRDLAKDANGNWKGQQWDVDIEECGFKFNMNNIAAAIGLSQLPYIDVILESHNNNAVTYATHFKNNEFVSPIMKHPMAQSSNWVYTMIVNDTKHVDRDELLRLLNAEGIMAGLVHVPNDSYTAFKNNRRDLPGVREFAAHQFSLPCGWWLQQADIEYIASRVSDLARKVCSNR